MLGRRSKVGREACNNRSSRVGLDGNHCLALSRGWSRGWGWQLLSLLDYWRGVNTIQRLNLSTDGIQTIVIGGHANQDASHGWLRVGKCRVAKDGRQQNGRDGEETRCVLHGAGWFVGGVEGVDGCGKGFLMPVVLGRIGVVNMVVSSVKKSI